MQVLLVIIHKNFCRSQCRFFLPFNRTINLFPPALQDLEPQQLLLFVQSFGIPVSSMSKLLQYLDQAVSHDPQTLEQNIMDKRKILEKHMILRFIVKYLRSISFNIFPEIDYMAHLVEVQHERGATGGHTFHALLSSSLPPDRGW